MSRISRIHIEVTYGTYVGDLINILEDVKAIDTNASITLDSAGDLYFAVNKDLQEENEIKKINEGAR